MIAPSIIVTKFEVDGIPAVAESRVRYRMGESDLHPRTVTLIAEVERVSLELHPATLADAARLIGCLP